MAVPVVLAGLSMLGPFSIDTPFPSFVDIQHEFGVTEQATQQVVSAYLLSFAVMSAFHGPLSDAIGRRTVMLGGVGVYALASVGAALAPSIAVLLVCRVLQGLSAGGGVIVSRTVIRDLYSGAEAQRLMSRVMMIFGLAPAVAPIIGGWLLSVSSWRGVFWFLTLVAIALAVTVVVVLPETHPSDRRTPLRVGQILGSLVEVGRSGEFQRVAWAGTFMFAAYFLYVGSAAIVVVDLLHQGRNDFWMLFVPLISGFILGSWINGRAAGRTSEYRLVGAAMTVGVVAAGVNLTLALVADHLPWAVVGPALLGISAGIGFPTVQLIVLDMFPGHRGAAASAATFLTLLTNAVFAGVVAPVVTGSLAGVAVTSLALVVAGAALWVWHTRRPVAAEERA